MYIHIRAIFSREKDQKEKLFPNVTPETATASLYIHNTHIQIIHTKISKKSEKYLWKFKHYDM